MVIIGSSSVDSTANGPVEEDGATPTERVGTNQQGTGNEIHHNDHIEILVSPRIIRPSLHLLSREARVDYITICVPLYNAALKGDWEAASGIIEVYPTVVRAGITRAWETALHIAAAARRTHFVEELVRKMNPDDLTLQDQTGNTALCYAASAGAMGIAEVMVIKNPALPSVRGSHRVTPLYMATSFGHHEMVWFLYKHTRDEDLEDEDRIEILNTICVPLYNAALKGDWEAASRIIEMHPDVVRAGITRALETALHVAAAAKRTRFVEELVRKMNPDDLALQDQTGNTALCYVASAGVVGIAEVMVDKNPALPSVRGSHRVTPLYMAASFGHHEMAWFLYKHTRDEDLEDEDRIEILNTRKSGLMMQAYSIS